MDWAVKDRWQKTGFWLLMFNFFGGIFQDYLSMQICWIMLGAGIAFVGLPNLKIPASKLSAERVRI